MLGILEDHQRHNITLPPALQLNRATLRLIVSVFSIISHTSVVFVYRPLAPVDSQVADLAG